MNADPIAALYRYLEYLSFGPLLWHARTQYLNHLMNKQRILILGEGDGRFLHALLEINPTAEVDCYDTSSRMLDLAKSRTIPHHHRIHFHQQDILEATLPLNTYDAIAANFIFDCFDTPTLETLIRNLKPAAKPDCLWLISDFAIPQNAPVHHLAKILTRFLYLCFAITTDLKTRKLPDIHSALTKSSLHMAQRKHRLWGAITSELWKAVEQPQLSMRSPKPPLQP